MSTLQALSFERFSKNWRSRVRVFAYASGNGDLPSPSLPSGVGKTPYAYQLSMKRTTAPDSLNSSRSWLTLFVCPGKTKPGRISASGCRTNFLRCNLGCGSCNRSFSIFRWPQLSHKPRDPGKTRAAYPICAAGLPPTPGGWVDLGS